MNWENCDFGSDGEEEAKISNSETNFHTKAVHEENEQKKLTQLQKWQNPPDQDERRQKYIAMASSFGELLADNKYEEIARCLLNEDCEAFLFNYGEITPVKYTVRSQDFTNLFTQAKVIKKKVEEINVDVENATAFQICYCEVFIEHDKSIIPQFSLETFSFRDGKISKYRGTFGSSSSFDEFNHPFIASTKDKMLAKVKELNYAWAGQPDFEKIATLLHSSTEYKIWSWEDQKGYTFYKNDFVGFKSIEENYEIKCVVPYDVYSEGQFIMGNYAFHLEGKDKLAGQKFVWLSTCIYSFDKYLNIAKINQQGELHNEDEIEIPWEVYSREKIMERILDVYRAQKKGEHDQDWCLMGNNDFAFSIEVVRFGPKKLSSIEHVKGFQDYKKLCQVFKDKDRNFDWSQVVDMYFDNCGDSYDVAFTTECLKGTMNREGYKYSGIEMSFFCIKKFCIENGRAAKMILFFCEIPEVIPSPFDDHTFTALNIKRKEDIV